MAHLIDNKKTTVYIIYNPENPENMIWKGMTKHSFKLHGFERIRLQPRLTLHQFKNTRKYPEGLDFELDLHRKMKPVHILEYYTYASVLRKLRPYEHDKFIITHAGPTIYKNIEQFAYPHITRRQMWCLGTDHKTWRAEPYYGLYLTGRMARRLFSVMHNPHQVDSPSLRPYRHMKQKDGSRDGEFKYYTKVHPRSNEDGIARTLRSWLRDAFRIYINDYDGDRMMRQAILSNKQMHHIMSMEMRY